MEKQKLKVYVSGKISGINIEVARQNFDESCQFIESLGMDAVNPMENGLPDNSTWEAHMLRDIEMLMGCNAIYMSTNWMDSRGARIEYAIAKERNMMIFMASALIPESRIVSRINNAIEEATGIRFEQYTAPGRKQERHYARMIFSHWAVNHENLSTAEVGVILNRHSSKISRCLKCYHTEYSVNKHFRKMADKVKFIINNVSQQYTNSYAKQSRIYWFYREKARNQNIFRRR